MGLVGKSKKIVAVLLALIGLITALFLYLGHLHYKVVLESIVGSERDIATKIYSNTFRLITDHYDSVALNLLMRDEVIEAFDQRDREKLLALTLPLFQKMQAQNPYLDIMHFHTPDSHSFLRVHEPSKFGDDLSSFRFIVNDVNKYKKKMIGMEVGRYGFNYRVILPVFNKKHEHIGSFEFGLNMKYIYDILNHEYKIKNVVLIKKDVFAINYKKNKDLRFLPFSNDYKILDPSEIEIAKQIPSNILTQQYVFFEEKGVSYMAYPVTVLKDVKDKEIGQIVFIKNMDEYTSAIVYIRNMYIFLGLFLIMVSYYLMKMIFDRYTKTIETYQNQLERKNKTLSALNNIDFLTKINNRRFLQKSLNKELKRSARYNNALSVILFDVDNFKSINDTYGHNAGDRVLKNIAKILMKMTRESDYVGRWGGEEFIVITPQTSLENAAVLAEEIRIAIERFDFALSTQVTCSFGVSELSDEKETNELVRKADHALYEAKHSGKNCVVLYDITTDQDRKTI